MKLKNLIYTNRLFLAGGVMGAVGGFLYWKFVGCSGGCAITSHPRNSILYFALLGAFTLSLFQKSKK